MDAFDLMVSQWAHDGRLRRQRERLDDMIDAARNSEPTVQTGAEEKKQYDYWIIQARTKQHPNLKVYAYEETDFIALGVPLIGMIPNPERANKFHSLEAAKKWWKKNKDRIESPNTWYESFNVQHVIVSSDETYDLE